MLRRERGVRHGRNDGGAAAVEFGLIAPLLILLVFGLIQYGLFFWSMQGGSSAAREAARRAAVGQFPICADFEAYVKARIGATGDQSSAVITRTYTDATTGATVAPADAQVGDVVTVSVKFKSIDMKMVPIPNDGFITELADSRVEYVPTAPKACP